MTGTSKARPLNDAGREKLTETLALCLVVAAVTALYSALFNRETTLSNEIGYNLVAAERVLDGELPYRDFLTLYPPATVYLNAALFAWLGVGLYTALAGVLVFKILTTLGVYLAARLVMPRGWAIGAALGAAIWLRPNGPFKSAPMQYGGLFLTLALLALLKYRTSHKRFLLFALGASLGLLALFKHNIGAYALLGSLLFVLLEGRARKARARKSATRTVWAVAGGFALPLVPVFLYMGAKGAFRAMFDALLLAPGEFLTSRLVLPAEPLLWAPLLVFAVAALLNFRANEERRFNILALLICAVAAVLEAFPRFAREQLVAGMPFVTLLLFYLIFAFSKDAERRPDNRLKASLVLAIAPAVFLLIGVRLFFSTYFQSDLIFKSDAHANVDRARKVCFPQSTSHEIEEVVAYIQRRVPAGGSFFAHSREGASFLFLAERKNPSAAQFWAGVGVTPSIRASTLQAIQSRGVNLVVTSDKDLAAERWEPMRDYLNQSFRATWQNGDILILERTKY